MRDVAAIQHKIDRNEALVQEAEVCLSCVSESSVADMDDQARRAACDKKVEQLEEELEALGNVDTLQARKEEISRKIKEGKAKHTQLKVCIGCVCTLARPDVRPPE